MNLLAEAATKSKSNVVTNRRPFSSTTQRATSKLGTPSTKRSSIFALIKADEARRRQSNAANRVTNHEQNHGRQRETSCLQAPPPGCCYNPNVLRRRLNFRRDHGGKVAHHCLRNCRFFVRRVNTTSPFGAVNFRRDRVVGKMGRTTIV